MKRQAETVELLPTSVRCLEEYAFSVGSLNRCKCSIETSLNAVKGLNSVTNVTADWEGQSTKQFSNLQVNNR